MPNIPALEPRFEDIALHMRSRNFRAVAEALRARIGPILHRWRAQSLKTMPGLDRFTVAEFEDSIAALLHAIADAMETDDPAHLRRIIAQAPLHGADRFLQQFTLDALLVEAGILRASIIVELREHMHAGLTEEEAASLHELVDLALDHSVLTFIRRRNDQREDNIQHKLAGVQRLADLGTLVAGVAHDAANLMLPLRMSVDRLNRCKLDTEARANVQLIERVFHHFQNTIVNLRWLTVDAASRPKAAQPLNLYDFAIGFEQFVRAMLPRSIELIVDVPRQLPDARITHAALSQILFNLVRNAQQAILAASIKRGRITLRARASEPGMTETADHPASARGGGGGAGRGGVVDVVVEDDGPGMPAAVLERCMEPFFTTQYHPESTGLGLALVHALVSSAGGTIEIQSPPASRSTPPAAGDPAAAAELQRPGTAVILRLPATTTTTTTTFTTLTATPTPTTDTDTDSDDDSRSRRGRGQGGEGRDDQATELNQPQQPRRETRHVQ